MLSPRPTPLASTAPPPFRFQCPESTILMAMFEPDTYVTELLRQQFESASFEHDPDSLLHSGPDERGVAWGYMLGEASIEDEAFPTSVTMYHPEALNRWFATHALHRDATAHVSMHIGRPVPSPHEAYRVAGMAHLIR